MALDRTHAADLRSWVDSANGHPEFPIQNLPLGVFNPLEGGLRVGVAIGEMILDLARARAQGLISGPGADATASPPLNGLMAHPPAVRRDLRRQVSALLEAHGDRAKAARAAAGRILHRAADCVIGLPAAVGDYTDFYAGIHHAANVGGLFRPDAPLLPNYKHVPIGYHGRASSICPSGAEVLRPNGQWLDAAGSGPVFGPTRQLDYELELAVWIGPGSTLGEPVPISEAREHLFGLSILNDWSARDIQRWEYQPLGPFLAKNFMTTVSPWVVTAEALEPFVAPQPPRPDGDPRPLPYLMDEADQAGGAYAIELEVLLSTAAMRASGIAPHRLSRTHAADLYWTIGQLIAHHTSGGCDLRPGDVLGTGTISSPGEGGQGSLLELSAGGREPVVLPGGEGRTFLEDGDEVIMRAHCRREGLVPIGFGECRGLVRSRS